MTKEELRESILELDCEMDQEDSRAAIKKLSKERDELTSELERILYNELEGISLKVITEKIIERYDINTDTLVYEYLESGDLEKSFIVAAEVCDCGWKEDIKKELLK